MDTKMIECKLIDAPKVDSRTRTFSKEFAVKLADSLDLVGLINPIVVRLNPIAPGRYMLVAGRHRLYGIRNVLKERLIRATVIENMSDADAAISADIDNLWSHPLNKSQHAIAIKRWHSYWVSKMPPITGTAQKAYPESEARFDAVIAAFTGQPIDVVRQLRAVAAAGSPEQFDTMVKTGVTKTGGQGGKAARFATQTEADFDARVAATTGQSLRSVARTKQIANAFTADQLEVFTQMEVNQTDMVQIAKIKDENLRAEVVNLIASGMVVADAIKETKAGTYGQHGSRDLPHGKAGSNAKFRSTTK